jgi:glycosyltransferase involved in cell wall biosynthesis
MKKISIVIPTYNELENIELLVNELNDLLNEKLSAYSNEIIIIDNYSTDGTRDKIKEICSRNENVKGILNAKNFGQLNSPFYGMTQATGDAVILMVADFQDPPKMILDFIDEWEKGYKIVIGIKSKSKESKLMYFLRTLYYKMINKIANVDHIEHFTGFGLYDKDFINILRKLEDPSPYLRGIVAELGFTRKELNYEQPQRKFGKTKNNFYSLYDIGMLGITSYSKVILRISTFVGFIVGGLSFLLSVIYLILKLIFWYSFPVGTAPILIGIFFLGGLQLFFIGILGEYIMNINTKILKRPLVIEEERINFIEDRNLNNDK